MTINSQTRTAGPFVGTGTIVPYPFTFKVFQASDLLVTQTDASGIQSALTLSVDYTVTLNVDQNVSPGGVVTPLAAIAVGASISVTSRLAVLQPASLTNSGGFYPRVIEDALDRLTIIMQEQGFVSSRQTLRVPEIGGVPVLPALANRANRVLAFDAFGDPIAIVGVDADSAASLAIDLANSASSTRGAGMVGFSSALGYAAGTVGRWLKDLATSAGSTLIGFLQAGTGAVLRSIQSKSRDTVSVKDFGAIGDAVADDTAAIQAAVDYVTNGTVEFPAGAYNITSPIRVGYNNTDFQNCVNLKGVGQGATLLWNGGDNEPMIWYEGTTLNAGFYSKTVIEGLLLKNQVLASGTIGIQIGNLASPLGMGAGVLNVTIRNNKFIDQNICVQTEYESDGINIEDNVFEKYTGFGVYNTGSAGMRVLRNQFALGKAGAVAVYAEYSAITVSDNLIQSTEIGVLGSIYLQDVSAFSVTGNYMENGYPGPGWAVLVKNSNAGYIGHNTIQGVQGADAIYIDATSSDIEVGPNSYGFFGFPMASLVRADAGSRGVNVAGNQDYVLAPVSISNASPAIVASTIGVAGMQANEAVYFTTTGSLPTGISALTVYYAKNVVGASFEVSLTPGGASINTSSAGSGVHKCHIVLANALSGTGFNFSYNNDYLLFGTGVYTNSPNSGVTAAKTGVLNIGNSAQAAGWAFQNFSRSGVSIGSITQSGTTGVAYNTSSDYRLKTIDGPLQGSGAFIDALKPCEGSWKADGDRFVGFLAHEVQEVSPGTVQGSKDEMQEVVVMNGGGTPQRLVVPKYQAMEYGSSEFIANIVAELQSLRARVRNLEP